MFFTHIFLLFRYSDSIFLLAQAKTLVIDLDSLMSYFTSNFFLQYSFSTSTTHPLDSDHIDHFAISGCVPFFGLSGLCSGCSTSANLALFPWLMFASTLEVSIEIALVLEDPSA